MRIVFFCRSLLKDWSHGSAHFLRGVAVELQARQHDVKVYHPTDGSGSERHTGVFDMELPAFRRVYPSLSSKPVDLNTVRLDDALDGADLVLVHESTPHGLVAQIGRHQARQARSVLLFHDTDHRSVTDPARMSRYDLHRYDGVLVFGDALRQRYLALGWARRAWTWHEAADTRIFTPRVPSASTAELVWLGNWDDAGRACDIRRFVIEPSRALQLSTTIHGVGYSDASGCGLETTGIRYEGWLPNYKVPDAYAGHQMTVHIPRQPYRRSLPGIPTIRVFEALACGIPLISVPWQDVEGLFSAGEDFLVASTPDQMQKQLAALRSDPALRQALTERGLQTIRGRHTCAHRVTQLLEIVKGIRSGVAGERLSA